MSRPWLRWSGIRAKLVALAALAIPVGGLAVGGVAPSAHAAEALAPGVPVLPSWTLVPRTATSVPLGVAELPGVGAPPPWTIPLAHEGYVEEEYSFSSTANLYSADGSQILTPNVPYTSR